MSADKSTATVTPLAGEWFRFHVTSMSQPEFPHLVDLEPFGWNGQCSCEHFRFRLQPGLSKGEIKPGRAGRCRHLRLARETMLMDLLVKLKRVVERQPLK